MRRSRSVISLLAALLLVSLFTLPAFAVEGGADNGYPEGNGYPEPDTEQPPPVVDNDVTIDDDVVEDDDVAVEDEVTELEDDADDERQVSALAFSGSNTTPLVLGGLVLAMLGGLLLIAARRKTSAQ